MDIDGNTAEHRGNFNSWFFDLFQESAGERAVAAGAVSRNLIGLRRKGYDHAARRFNSRKTPCLDKIALHAARTETLRERIVAACVQDQNFYPAGLRQREQDVVNARQFVVDAVLIFQPGIDGHQIIEALILNAVTSVINKRRIGFLSEAPKVRHRLFQRALVDVFYGDDVETDFLQGESHIISVIGGISEAGGILVRGIANYERNALFRACRDRTGSNREQHQKDRRESVHLLPPHSLMISGRTARTLGSRQT